MIQHPSPNFNERPEHIVPNVLVLHYTGMKTAEDALNRMCDPQAEVSAHYMINENGDIYQLVDESMRAWHAGISCWRGRASVNDVSIGIEIVNPGHEHGYREFPDAQMQAVIELAGDIKQRHDIENRNIVGHSDIAPRRKQDPGELFNWKLLAEHNIGLWPKKKHVFRPKKILIKPQEESSNVAHVQGMLADYGYHIRMDGYFGEKTHDVITAFKRHFAQTNVDDVWDNRTNSVMRQLLKLIK